MVRFHLITVLALSTASLTLANPVDQVALQPDVPVYTTDGWRWEDCGQPTDAIRIERIIVTPDPPQPGKDMTVKVTGEAQSVIEDGAYVDVTVKLGLIKLLQKTFDVCEEARKANATIQCPVQPGKYTVEHTVALPREIPKANFRVDVKGYTAQEDDMVCLNLRVDFMKNPFPRLGW
ncbi:Phosphatidylglycerol/phosphatidylinositol transfer protein [Termitomyces sp. J132]|nr:Phosphatidylglycerol/phosphatidylinositol transfer protein [Termitomyces sp. 'cryptogamus']KNZ71433.1 Phosphatidylglycerol/phosphatidylinositol transfer protein [Termitomyces sp. J132]